MDTVDNQLQDYLHVILSLTSQSQHKLNSCEEKFAQITSQVLPLFKLEKYQCIYTS